MNEKRVEISENLSGSEWELELEYGGILGNLVKLLPSLSAWRCYS